MKKLIDQMHWRYSYNELMNHEAAIGVQNINLHTTSEESHDEVMNT